MRKAVRAALSTARTARTPGPLARYGQLVTKGRLRRDAAQVAVLEHLGRLHRVLAREREARDADAAARAVWATTTKEEEPSDQTKECIIDPRAVGRKAELRKRRGTTGSEALDRVLNQSNLTSIRRVLVLGSARATRPTNSDATRLLSTVGIVRELAH